MSELTQDKLKSLLHYNPRSGEFTWKTSPSRKVSAGDIAGYPNNLGYIKIGINRKSYGAHRLAFLYMTGVMPSVSIDHQNHNPNDNRWENIIEAGQELNGKNRRQSVNNKTGITGVYTYRNRKKIRFGAVISLNKKQHYIYTGYDFFEACCARKSAEIKYGYHPNHGAYHD